MGCYFLESSQ